MTHVGDEAELIALRILGGLLGDGLRAEMIFGARSLKNQMRQAEASRGAPRSHHW